VGGEPWRRWLRSRARLKDTFGKAEINDLANLAFISDKANRKISARPPAVYFEELDAEDLERHFVPTDPNVRSVDRYPDLVAQRRALLATAMNDVLDWVRLPWRDVQAAAGMTPSR
jgi:hypothetical protein